MEVGAIQSAGSLPRGVSAEGAFDEITSNRCAMQFRVPKSSAPKARSMSARGKKAPGNQNDETDEG